MPRLAFDSYFDWVEQQGNNVGQLVGQAAQGYCNLYKQYPKFFYGPNITPESPSFPFAKGLNDALCNRDPLDPTPSPQPPFDGGQCAILYDLTIQQSFTVTKCSDGSVVDQGTETIVSPGYLGPIVGIRKEAINSSSCGTDAWVGIATWNGGASEGQVTGYSAGGDSAIDYQVEIISVVPSSGQPDDCGNPPPQWPADKQDDPPPGDLVPNLPVPGLPGTDITVPIVYAPITLTFEIPIKIGPVDFNFDLGGLTFNFELDQGDNIVNLPPGDDSPADLLPPEPAPFPPEVGDKIDDILDNTNRDPASNPPLSPDDYSEQPRSTDDPKEQKGLDLDFVCVTLTKLPIERKQQFGEGAPDVLYAGWFEWLIDDCALPREPIHFQKSVFSKPNAAVNGYAYTLTNAAEGFATEFTRTIPSAV